MGVEPKICYKIAVSIIFKNDDLNYQRLHLTPSYSDWAFFGIPQTGGIEIIPSLGLPVTFLQLKLLRRYFDNSKFVPSLFNFCLVSNDMTSYDVTMTLLLSKYWVFIKSSWSKVE